MADLPTPNLDTTYWPALVGGVRSTAPPRSLGDPAGQHIWRDTLNMQARDGVTIGRPGIASAPAVASDLPAPPTITSVDTAETARYINFSSDASTGLFAVVVTTNHIYIYYSGTWRDATPTYNVGTVTATNGNTSITGAGGTLWLTRAIGVAHITIDGATYLMTTTGEATATIAPAFTGATGAGKAYSITRILLGDPFAVLYNETLYVGCPIGTSGRPAVIKVANVFSTSPATSIVTGSHAFEAATDAISGLTRIAGITALQDGRVVFPGNTNEVFYSSNLSDAVWTVAPGGSTPLADVDTIITSMGRVGAALTFHHSGGIVLGDPTNIADPPLRFQATGATKGCVAPKTLYPYAGGEAFLALDGNVKLFDGANVVSLGGEEMASRLRAITGGTVYLVDFFAWVNARGEYNLARMRFATGGELNDGTTRWWTYQPANDSWWPNQAAIEFGAVGDYDKPAQNLTAVGVTAQGVVGCKSGSGTRLRLYVEGSADGSGTPTYYLETDDLDHGQPLALKTPQRVTVWPVAAMTSLKVEAREHTAASYTQSVTHSPTLATPSTTYYDFEPGQAVADGSVPASDAHRYKLSGSTLRLGLFGLAVRAKVHADREAV